MKKAQSLIEVALILALVSVIAYAAFAKYNDMKLKLVKMSSITVRDKQD